jgi:hypothetical protein
MQFYNFSQNWGILNQVSEVEKRNVMVSGVEP